MTEPQEFAHSHPDPQPGLSRFEQKLVDSIEVYLKRGRQLRRWWVEAIEHDRFEEKFPLSFTFNRPDYSFGFFDETQVDGAPLPIMGNYQTMFYDQPKSPPRGAQVEAIWMRDQIREFALRYFMRVSDFRQPQAIQPGPEQPLPRFLRPFSLCADPQAQNVGFGFSQLLYKETNGRVGRFPAAERNAIVDLRQLGPRFEWIVVKVKIFDFDLTVAPFGSGGPSCSLPLTEDSYLVLSSDFILNEERPQEGELGHYGLGYAFIKSPRPGPFGFGPGEFDAAIQLIDFHVYRDGRVRVDASFVANRPTEVLSLSVNPLNWMETAANAVAPGLGTAFLGPITSMMDQLPFASIRFDPVPPALAAANLATAGFAARELCLSMRGLEETFLLKHFMQHFVTLAGSIQTWRQIRDWTDEASLPRWVIDGKSA